MLPVPIATATCCVIGRRSPAIQTPGTLVSPRWDSGWACWPVGRHLHPELLGEIGPPAHGAGDEERLGVQLRAVLELDAGEVAFLADQSLDLPGITGIPFSRSRSARGSESAGSAVARMRSFSV